MFAALLLATLASSVPQASPPAAAATHEAAQDRAALEALNRDWLTAYRTRDVAALDRVLADDFEAVYPGGAVLRKADVLKTASDPDRVITAITWDKLKIMVFGDVAMVTAQTSIAGTAAGKPFAAVNDYADVYVRRAGTWRAVSAHVVRVSP